MKKTSANVVTVTLKQPDFWLDGELSQMPGVVVEKAFAESKGRKLGTPQGGLMCSGPYKVGSWKAGSTLNVVRNDSYWDASHKAKVAEIDFRGVPDDASMTSGFLTGGIDGSYPQGAEHDRPAQGGQGQGHGLAGPVVRERRDRDLEPQGRARRRAGPAGAVARHRPQGLHPERLPRRRAAPAHARQPRDVGLRPRGLPGRLGRAPRARRRTSRRPRPSSSRPARPARRSRSA